MSTPEVKPLETLNGYSEFKVGKFNGDVETVKVKQLPVSKMAKYAEAQDDELLMITLATGKDEKWLEAVTPASQIALIQEIERVNADFFLQWVERKKGRMEKLLPGATERVLSALQTSQSKSPQSAA